MIKEKNTGKEDDNEGILVEKSEEKRPAKEHKEKDAHENEVSGAQKAKPSSESKEEIQLLLPLEEYIKANVHIGTKTISPTMRQYVYRRKADGVAILNTNKIDEKIKAASKFINNFDAKDIILVCRRDAGWKAAEAFGKTTGIRYFLKYPPGIITNPSLENFFEPKLVILCDPTLDKNVLRDAAKIHVPVVAIVGTSNSTSNIDLVIPANNRFDKSIGVVLYLLAKSFNDAKGSTYPVSKEVFYGSESPIPEIRREEKIREKEEDRAKLIELVKRLKEKKAKKKEEEAHENEISGAQKAKPSSEKKDTTKLA